VVAHGIVLAVSSGALRFEVAVLGLAPELGAILNTGINASLGFVLMRSFVFR
jgi:hypothetical protein